MQHEDEEGKSSTFSSTTLRWREIKGAENIPRTGRLCHTITPIHGHRLFCWGGWGGEEERYTDAFIFDVELEEWTPVECKGDVPAPRSTHSMTSINGGKQLLLFAGYLGGERRANDMHILDVDSLTWRLIQPKNGVVPPARNTHTATLLGDGRRIVVFGGRNSSHFFNDVWMFDIPTTTWTPLTMSGNDNIPSGRSGHSAVLKGDNRIIIFGGWDGGRNRFGQVWELDPLNQKWILHDPMAIDSHQPAARSGHTAALLNQQEMVVFGGWGEGIYRSDVYILHLERMEWRLVAPAGIKCPSPRRFHAMASIPPFGAFIHGGKSHDYQHQYNDMFVLSVGPPSLQGMCKQHIKDNLARYKSEREWPAIPLELRSSMENSAEEEAEKEEQL
ncbi:DUF11 domain-containing protein [Balamuthia mandrillaris]